MLKIPTHIPSRTPQCFAIRACTLAFTLAACAALAPAQQPATPAAPPASPPKPASFSGCVTKAPGSADLVISTPTVCARLTGDAASADKLAGHQVDLTGLFTPRDSSTSASIKVDSVKKVGAACSEVCSLHPPSARGLQRPNNQAIPGSEGGTPGAVAEPK
jgi:hypothetical protein